MTQKWAYAARTIATGALAAAQLLTACSRTSYHLTTVVGSAQQTFAGRCKQQQTTRHANFQNTCKKTNCCPRQPRDLHCRKGFATANQVHSSTSQHKSTAKPITSFQEAACTGQLDSLSLPKCGHSHRQGMLTRYLTALLNKIKPPVAPLGCPAGMGQHASDSRMMCAVVTPHTGVQAHTRRTTTTQNRPGRYTQNHHSVGDPPDTHRTITTTTHPLSWHDSLTPESLQGLRPQHASSPVQLILYYTTEWCPD